jgi:hypothetical protein
MNSYETMKLALALLGLAPKGIASQTLMDTLVQQGATGKSAADVLRRLLDEGGVTFGDSFRFVARKYAPMDVTEDDGAFLPFVVDGFWQDKTGKGRTNPYGSTAFPVVVIFPSRSAANQWIADNT